MKNKLKSIFVLALCLPAFLLCGCKKKTPSIDLNYYFNQNVMCSFFGSRSSSNALTVDCLTQKKLNTDYLDRYAEIIVSSNGGDKNNITKVYHLYIDYIKFYVYTNESYDGDLVINLTISNVINVGETNLTDTDKKHISNLSMKPQAGESAEFVVDIQKVVATLSDGCSISFDILTNEIFSGNQSIDDLNTFKWMIYGLEIHAEPRAYTTKEI